MRSDNCLRNSVQARRVVPKQISFESFRNILALPEFNNGVGKVTIAVGVVGGKDNSIFSEDVSRMRQSLLVRFARDKATFALYVFARCFEQIGKPMRTGRVVIIHAPHPIGQPGGAYFEKNKFDAGVFLHHSAADQGHDSDHQIERHTDHMDVKIRVLEAFLTRAVETTCNPVDPYRCSKFIRLIEKWLEVGIVEIPLTGDSRNHGSHATELLDRSSK